MNDNEIFENGLIVRELVADLIDFIDNIKDEKEKKEAIEYSKMMLDNIK